jgi:predicted Zn-dependent protease
LPDLGDSSDSALSEPQERAIGKRIMLEIRADRSFIEDSELSDYIIGIGNRLVAASHGATNDNRREFEFFMLNDDSINAFALLGGFIGIHTGLLLATNNESELAGVLGHEISHILQRHQSRGMEGQKNKSWLPLAGLLAAILAARSNSSSSSQATEAAIYGSQALAIQNQLDYSRDFEREADRLGIQVISRAGYDVRGMVSFFERLLRANRHNDGKTPGYLRSHPLTTERIADMQSRVDQMGAEGRLNVTDSADYRFAQAKARVLSLGPKEAAAYFRNTLAGQTVLRNRADAYGLALSLAAARDFVPAEKEIESIRTGKTHAWIENLSAEIQAGQRKWDKALAQYRIAMKQFPSHRGMLYGYLNTLYEAGQTDLAIREISEQLKNLPEDPRLYELAAKGYERKNKRLAQHRAIGEAYFRRGNMIGAIEQLEMAVKARDGDFYESSSAESRLREFKVQFRNRALLPGEKPDREKSGPDLRDHVH